MKRLASWFLPEAVLLLATVIALRLDALQDTLPSFARFYPYAVFIVGGLLAWRFHRTRLLFALLLLALAALVLKTSVATPAGRVGYRAAALLLPLNLGVLVLLNDRGVVTPIGLLRLLAIAVQVVVVQFLKTQTPAAAAATLGYALLPARWFAWTQLPQPALLAFVIGLVVAALPLVFEQNATARGFLWAIVATFLAFNTRGPGPQSAIYLGTAGLILVVAVIEASYLLAYQDGLTELPARRALTEAMQRLAGQYTVAMIDVDHFKRFNDSYGHDAGDQVLRMVASKLGEVTGGGRAYRYGGEEFAILFPGKSLEEALPHLEEIRAAVADSAFTIRRRLRTRRGRDKASRPRHKVSITVSVGAAEPNGRHSAPDQVLRAADQALYRAKEEGRNRVRS